MNYYKTTYTTHYYLCQIPPRCRKPRLTEMYGNFQVKVPSITTKDAPLAFRLSDFGHVENETTEIRLYKKKLYKKIWNHNYNEQGVHDPKRPYKADIPQEKIADNLHVYIPYEPQEEITYDYVQKKVNKAAKEYLIIDGIIWRECREPRYEIITFGLGHNHGGTGLFVTEFYNGNISNKRYFNALQGKEAIEEFKKVALGRGDTDSVKLHEKEMIEVFIPECVKLNPMKDHGRGNDFLNMLDDISQKSNSTLESGLLSLAATAAFNNN